MKTNCWLILGTMLATTAVAQVNTNKLPEIPPPATATPATPVPPPNVMTADSTVTTNAPAKKAVKSKKKAKKAKVAAKPSAKASEKAAEKKAEKNAPEMPVTLVPGQALAAAEHVNLRGQAGLQGEVVGHVQKGDVVTVLAEITLDKPKAGEPAQWAKIALPSGTKVWLNAKYVDATNNVVTAKKLNLRGGPGENYSVLGVIEKGASVTQVTTKGDWMQIQTPASAFAFVAASLLKQGAGMTGMGTPPTVASTAESVPPPAPPVVPPTPTTVAEAPTIAPPAATPPATVESVPPPAPPTTAPETASAAPPVTPEMSAPTPTPTLVTDTNSADVDTNPPPPRIVTHEGSVRHSVSPVAPTYYELYEPTDNKAIDYLFSSTTNLNLTRYNGLHITVTGEEALDPRWQDTPVLTIQKIYVLADDRAKMKPVSTSKGSK